MKKSKLISLSLIITMLITPFSLIKGASGAPPPSYMGVSEGQSFIWKINVNTNTLGTFIDDINTTVYEIYDFIEAETNGLKDFLRTNLSDYLDFNLADAITEMLANYTSNSTYLPTGWVDMNASELIATIINDVLLEGQGQFPEDWMGLNMTLLIEELIDAFITPSLFEDGWLDSYNISKMFDVLTENLTVYLEDNPAFDGWIDFNLTTLIAKILENVTADYMPPGWINMDFNSTLNALVDSGIIPEEWLDENILRFQGLLLENMTSEWLNITSSETREILQSLFDMYMSMPLIFFYASVGMGEPTGMESLYNSTVRELMSMTTPFGFPITYTNIESISDDFNFTISYNPYNQSFIGGVVMIYGMGGPGYYDVIDVIDNSTNLIIVPALDGVPVNLTELGYTAGNTVYFYTRPIDFSTMSIMDIIGDMVGATMAPISNMTMQEIMDFIESMLPMLVMMDPNTFTKLDITPPPDILALTINELIEFALEVINKLLFYERTILTKVQVISVDGDYNFTVAYNSSYASWDEKLVELPDMNLSHIVDIIDNSGDNVTIILDPTGPNLTETGLQVDDEVMIYNDLVSNSPFGFDLENLTTLDLIGAILGLNFTDFLSGYIDMTGMAIPDLSSFTMMLNLTIRENIHFFIMMLESALNAVANQPGAQIWADQIISIDSDFNLTIAGYYINPEFDPDSLIGSQMRRGASANNHTVLNAWMDMFNLTHIELVNIPANNLTTLGYIPSDPVYFYSNMTTLFQFNFTGWTLDELINYTIDEVLQPQLAEYMDYYNAFMGGDLQTYILSLQAYAQTMALKMQIDSIGEEIELYPGGIRGVPVNVSVFMSLDNMANWMDISLNFTNSLIISQMGVNGDIFIVDPSSNVPGYMMGVFSFQMMSSYCLLISNEFSWSLINSEMILPSLAFTDIPGLSINLQAISCIVSWTDEGVLENLEIRYGGSTAMQFYLYTEEVPPASIPGFEVVIVSAIVIISTIGLIYVVMKKKQLI